VRELEGPEQMKLLILKALERLFPTAVLRYRAYRRLILDPSSYLYLTGWMESLKERKPVKKNGTPVPWMNFPVVQFLEERLTLDLNLFEFGSGYSTFFYANRVGSVTSLEYDQKWFELVKSRVPKNVVVLFKEKDVDGDYCRVIASMKTPYDVIIVDGRDRVNCMKQSVFALTPRGVIILDDSQREYYRDGIEFAKEKGFRTIHFEGLKAYGNGLDRTTIFYREGNCLGI
jgi:hypothetical protein